MPAKRLHRNAPALFVYGSLLHRRFWRATLGAKGAASVRIVPARLRGWRRWWNGVGHSLGGAVLNLRRDPAGHLWGGLVEGLSEEAWRRLDEQERSHLPRRRVMVVTARGRRVWAHCYRQEVRGPEQMPAAAYFGAVRAGAKSMGGVVSRDVEADVERLIGKLAPRPRGGAKRGAGAGAGRATARGGRRRSSGP